MTPEHKNTRRAPLGPLNASTIALTSGGLGFLRPAPGSWGSIPPCAVMFGLLLAGVRYEVVQGAMLALFAATSVLCTALGGYAERRFGAKDAAEVVVDETAAVCIPLLAWPGAFVAACAMPTELSVETWTPPLLRASLAVGAAFVLFRVFDIFKPWPARALERWPRGWGVLADDLVAGLYAAAVMQVGLRLIG